MRQAPVSVVIPAYNSAAMVCDAVDSILGQTVPPAEVIVIDDGSSDDTAERVGAYGDRVLYRRQANAGPSAARNHGVSLCAGPLVAFLDADDVWHPRKLELQMRHMEGERDLGLLATDHFDWPAAAFPEAPTATAPVSPVTWEQLVIKATILTSSILVRRDVLARAGEFDSSLCGPEDRDMFLRLAEVTRLAKLNVPLIGYRDAPGSLTKQAAQCERGIRTILRRLDARGAWRGRRLLRQKAYSYMLHASASAQARAANHVGAVVREVKAMATYPLPYRREDVRMPCERLKRLAVNALRMVRLKAPDRAASAARRAPEVDALQAMRQRATPSRSLSSTSSASASAEPAGVNR